MPANSDDKLEEVFKKIISENQNIHECCEALYKADKDVKEKAPDRPTFLEPETFPFLIEFAKSWEAVRDEYLNLKEKGLIYQFTDSSVMVEENDDGWQTFELKFFSADLPEHRKLCPRTAKLMSKVPKATLGMFSILKPGAHIMPHAAHYEGAYRTHLGLFCPEDCGLRVGSDVREWEEGKFLVFDDTHEHEAWNKSKEPRVIFILDFWYPHLSTIPRSYQKVHELYRGHFVTSLLHLAKSENSEEFKEGALFRIKQLLATVPNILLSEEK